MLILILLLPFLGFLCGALFGKQLGRGGVCIITTLFTFFAFLLSIYTFFNILRFQVVYILSLAQWLSVDNLDVD